MRERISQISVSSRKNLSPGFHPLDTCISPAKSICDFDARPYISTAAGCSRNTVALDGSAAICFIHFSHSKFITFRKTDSFIPCVLKLFSTAVLDINDYGKIVIDSRERISRTLGDLIPFAILSPIYVYIYIEKIKCYVCDDSG